MGLDFDLDIDPDVANAAKASGGYLGAGKHEVALLGVTDEKASNGNTGVGLVFVDDGGARHYETIWNSAKENCRKRFNVLAYRLGLLVETTNKETGKKGYAFSPGKTELAHCLGERVVLELKADTKDLRKDGSPKIKMEWIGIHRVGEAETTGGQTAPANDRPYDI